MDIKQLTKTKQFRSIFRKIMFKVNMNIKVRESYVLKKYNFHVYYIGYTHIVDIRKVSGYDPPVINFTNKLDDLIKNYNLQEFL